MVSDKVFECGQRIHNGLSEGKIGVGGRVTFTDFDPSYIDGFTPQFAEAFGRVRGEEALVREALPFLEDQMGVHVERTLVRQPSFAGHGQPYPAEYKVTVSLH